MRASGSDVISSGPIVNLQGRAAAGGQADPFKGETGGHRDPFTRETGGTGTRSKGRQGAEGPVRRGDRGHRDPFAGETGGHRDLFAGETGGRGTCSQGNRGRCPSERKALAGCTRGTRSEPHHL